MSKKHHDILRHMTGLDRSKISFRNYFAANPDGDDFKDLEDMMSLGLVMRGATSLESNLVYFHATEAGMTAARLPFEHYAA